MNTPKFHCWCTPGINRSLQHFSYSWKKASTFQHECNECSLPYCTEWSSNAFCSRQLVSWQSADLFHSTKTWIFWRQITDIFCFCNSRSACFVEFVQLCLQKQPAVRPTAEDLLQVSSKWELIKLHSIIHVVLVRGICWNIWLMFMVRACINQLSDPLVLLFKH